MKNPSNKGLTCWIRVAEAELRDPLWGYRESVTVSCGPPYVKKSAAFANLKQFITCFINGCPVNHTLRADDHRDLAFASEQRKIKIFWEGIVSEARVGVK